MANTPGDALNQINIRVPGSLDRIGATGQSPAADLERYQQKLADLDRLVQRTERLQAAIREAGKGPETVEQRREMEHMRTRVGRLVQDLASRRRDLLSRQLPGAEYMQVLRQSPNEVLARLYKTPRPAPQVPPSPPTPELDEQFYRERGLHAMIDPIAQKNVQQIYTELDQKMRQLNMLSQVSSGTPPLQAVYENDPQAKAFLDRVLKAMRPANARLEWNEIVANLNDAIEKQSLGTVLYGMRGLPLPRTARSRGSLTEDQIQWHLRELLDPNKRGEAEPLARLSQLLDSLNRYYVASGGEVRGALTADANDEQRRGEYKASDFQTADTREGNEQANPFEGFSTGQNLAQATNTYRLRSLSEMEFEFQRRQIEQTKHNIVAMIARRMNGIKDPIDLFTLLDPTAEPLSQREEQSLRRIREELPETLGGPGHESPFASADVSKDMEQAIASYVRELGNYKAAYDRYARELIVRQVSSGDLVNSVPGTVVTPSLLDEIAAAAQAYAKPPVQRALHANERQMQRLVRARQIQEQRLTAAGLNPTEVAMRLQEWTARHADAIGELMAVRNDPQALLREFGRTSVQPQHLGQGDELPLAERRQYDVWDLIEQIERMAATAPFGELSPRQQADPGWRELRTVYRALERQRGLTGWGEAPSYVKNFNQRLGIAPHNPGEGERWRAQMQGVVPRQKGARSEQANAARLIGTLRRLRDRVVEQTRRLNDQFPDGEKGKLAYKGIIPRGFSTPLGTAEERAAIQRQRGSLGLPVLRDRRPVLIGSPHPYKDEDDFTRDAARGQVPDYFGMPHDYSAAEQAIPMPRYGEGVTASADYLRTLSRSNPEDAHLLKMMRDALVTTDEHGKLQFKFPQQDLHAPLALSGDTVRNYNQELFLNRLPDIHYLQARSQDPNLLNPFLPETARAAARGIADLEHFRMSFASGKDEHDQGGILFEGSHFSMGGLISHLQGLARDPKIQGERRVEYSDLAEQLTRAYEFYFGEHAHENLLRSGIGITAVRNALGFEQWPQSFIPSRNGLQTQDIVDNLGLLIGAPLRSRFQRHQEDLDSVLRAHQAIEALGNRVAGSGVITLPWIQEYLAGIGLSHEERLNVEGNMRALVEPGADLIPLEVLHDLRRVIPARRENDVVPVRNPQGEWIMGQLKRIPGMKDNQVGLPVAWRFLYSRIGAQGMQQVLTPEEWAWFQDEQAHPGRGIMPGLSGSERAKLPQILAQGPAGTNRGIYWQVRPINGGNPFYAGAQQFEWNPDLLVPPEHVPTEQDIALSRIRDAQYYRSLERTRRRAANRRGRYLARQRQVEIEKTLANPNYMQLKQAREDYYNAKTLEEASDAYQRWHQIAGGHLIEPPPPKPSQEAVTQPKLSAAPHWRPGTYQLPGFPVKFGEQEQDLRDLAFDRARKDQLTKEELEGASARYNALTPEQKAWIRFMSERISPSRMSTEQMESFLYPNGFSEGSYTLDQPPMTAHLGEGNEFDTQFLPSLRRPGWLHPLTALGARVGGWAHDRLAPLSWGIFGFNQRLVGGDKGWFRRMSDNNSLSEGGMWPDTMPDAMSDGNLLRGLPDWRHISPPPKNYATLPPSALGPDADVMEPQSAQGPPVKPWQLGQEFGRHGTAADLLTFPRWMWPVLSLYHRVKGPALSGPVHLPNAQYTDQEFPDWLRAGLDLKFLYKPREVADLKYGEHVVIPPEPSGRKYPYGRFRYEGIDPTRRASGSVYAGEEWTEYDEAGQPHEMGWSPGVARELLGGIGEYTYYGGQGPIYFHRFRNLETDAVDSYDTDAANFWLRTGHFYGHQARFPRAARLTPRFRNTPLIARTPPPLVSPYSPYNVALNPHDQAQWGALLGRFLAENPPEKAAEQQALSREQLKQQQINRAKDPTPIVAPPEDVDLPTSTTGWVDRLDRRKYEAHPGRARITRPLARITHPIPSVADFPTIFLPALGHRPGESPLGLRQPSIAPEDQALWMRMLRRTRRPARATPRLASPPTPRSTPPPTSSPVSAPPALATAWPMRLPGASAVPSADWMNDQPVEAEPFDPTANWNSVGIVGLEDEQTRAEINRRRVRAGLPPLGRTDNIPAWSNPPDIRAQANFQSGWDDLTPEDLETLALFHQRFTDAKPRPNRLNKYEGFQKLWAQLVRNPGMRRSAWQIVDTINGIRHGEMPLVNSRNRGRLSSLSNIFGSLGSNIKRLAAGSPAFERQYHPPIDLSTYMSGLRMFRAMVARQSTNFEQAGMLAWHRGEQRWDVLDITRNNERDSTGYLHPEEFVAHYPEHTPAMLYHNHPSAEGSAIIPSMADRIAAQTFGQHGIGSAIYMPPSPYVNEQFLDISMDPELRGTLQASARNWGYPVDLSPAPSFDPYAISSEQRADPFTTQEMRGQQNAPWRGNIRELFDDSESNALLYNPQSPFNRLALRPERLPYYSKFASYFFNGKLYGNDEWENGYMRQLGKMARVVGPEFILDLLSNGYSPSDVMEHIEAQIASTSRTQRVGIDLPERLSSLAGATSPSFTPEQQAIINDVANGKSVNIFGGAGTGKSRTALEAIAASVQAGKTDARDWTYYTPTRRLQESVGERATDLFGAGAKDRPNINTLGQLAMRVLRTEAWHGDPHIPQGLHKDFILGLLKKQDYDLSTVLERDARLAPGASHAPESVFRFARLGEEDMPPQSIEGFLAHHLEQSGYAVQGQDNYHELLGQGRPGVTIGQLVQWADEIGQRQDTLSPNELKAIIGRGQDYQNIFGAGGGPASHQSLTSDQVFAAYEEWKKANPDRGRAGRMDWYDVMSNASEVMEGQGLTDNEALQAARALAYPQDHQYSTLSPNMAFDESQIYSRPQRRLVAAVRAALARAGRLGTVIGIGSPAQSINPTGVEPESIRHAIGEMTGATINHELSTNFRGDAFQFGNFLLGMMHPGRRDPIQHAGLHGLPHLPSIHIGLHQRESYLRAIHEGLGTITGQFSEDGKKDGKTVTRGLRTQDILHAFESGQLRVNKGKVEGWQEWLSGHGIDPSTISKQLGYIFPRNADLKEFRHDWTSVGLPAQLLASTALRRGAGQEEHDYYNALPQAMTVNSGIGGEYEHLFADLSRASIGRWKDDPQGWLSVMYTALSRGKQAHLMLNANGDFEKSRLADVAPQIHWALSDLQQGVIPQIIQQMREQGMRAKDAHTYFAANLPKPYYTKAVKQMIDRLGNAPQAQEAPVQAPPAPSSSIPPPGATSTPPPFANPPSQAQNIPPHSARHDTPPPQNARQWIMERGIRGKNPWQFRGSNGQSEYQIGGAGAEEAIGSRMADLLNSPNAPASAGQWASISDDVGRFSHSDQWWAEVRIGSDVHGFAKSGEKTIYYAGKIPDDVKQGMDQLGQSQSAFAGAAFAGGSGDSDNNNGSGGGRSGGGRRTSQGPMDDDSDSATFFSRFGQAFGQAFAQAASAMAQPAQQSGGFLQNILDNIRQRANSPFSILGRSLARTGWEMSYISDYIQQQNLAALQQGELWRVAEGQQNILTGLGPGTYQPFGGIGIAGGFSGIYTDQGEEALAGQFPMYSRTQIRQLSANMAVQLGLRGQAATTTGMMPVMQSVMAASAVGGMDPNQVASTLGQLSGLSGGRLGTNQQAAQQYLNAMLAMGGGVVTNQTLQPFSQALATIAPLSTTFESNPMMGANYLVAGAEAGVTPGAMPQLATGLSELYGAGYNPSLEQQLALLQIYGNGSPTAVHQIFNPQYTGVQGTINPATGQYNFPAMDYQQLIAPNGLFTQLNNALGANPAALKTPAAAQWFQQLMGMEGNAVSAQTQMTFNVPQLNIQAAQAEINLQQAQIGEQATQLAYGYADYYFNLWKQNQEYGPIGADVSRSSYFDFERSAALAGYDFTKADTAGKFQPQTPFGLQNEEFYAGMEHQRSQMVLGRSKLTSDLAFQNNIEYINQQENFYRRELDIRNAEREFQQEWQKKLLDSQAGVLAAEEALVAIEQKLEQAQIPVLEWQAQVLPMQYRAMQAELAGTIYQGLGYGAGPNGSVITPQDVITQLNALQGQLSPQQFQALLLSMLAKDPGSYGVISDLIKNPYNLSNIEQSQSGQQALQALMQAYQKDFHNAAFGASQVQSAQSDSQLSFVASSGQAGALTDSTTAVLNNVGAFERLTGVVTDLAVLIAPFSVMGGIAGPALVGAGSMFNLLGILGAGSGAARARGGLLGALRGGNVVDNGLTGTVASGMGAAGAFDLAPILGPALGLAAALAPVEYLSTKNGHGLGQAAGSLFQTVWAASNPIGWLGLLGGDTTNLDTFLTGMSNFRTDVMGQTAAQDNVLQDPGKFFSDLWNNWSKGQDPVGQKAAADATAAQKAAALQQAQTIQGQALLGSYAQNIMQASISDIASGLGNPASAMTPQQIQAFELNLQSGNGNWAQIGPVYMAELLRQTNADQTPNVALIQQAFGKNFNWSALGKELTKDMNTGNNAQLQSDVQSALQQVLGAATNAGGVQKADANQLMTAWGNILQSQGLQTMTITANVVQLTTNSTVDNTAGIPNHDTANYIDPTDLTPHRANTYGPWSNPLSAQAALATAAPHIVQTIKDAIIGDPLYKTTVTSQGGMPGDQLTSVQAQTAGWSGQGLSGGWLNNVGTSLTKNLASFSLQLVGDTAAIGTQLWQGIMDSLAKANPVKMLSSVFGGGLTDTISGVIAATNWTQILNNALGGAFDFFKYLGKQMAFDISSAFAGFWNSFADFANQHTSVLKYIGISGVLPKWTVGSAPTYNPATGFVTDTTTINRKGPVSMGYARGGMVPRAGSYLVGEEGPEIVNLSAGSVVYPTLQTQNVLGQSKTVTLNLHIGGQKMSLNAKDKDEVMAELLKILETSLFE